jgi:hypothetical protein
MTVSLLGIVQLQTSFGAKPNVLQFCPLSDHYIVNVRYTTIMYVADVQPFYTHGKSVVFDNLNIYLTI